MAAGDFLVQRNNTNTDTIANTTGDLTAIWPTAVANQGSGITHSAGTFTLGETGHFLILWSDYITHAGVANERIQWESRINFAGSDIIGGSCTGYIRKNGQTNDFVVSGAVVVDVATTTGTGDEFFIHHVRDDTTTEATLPTRATGVLAGVTIIKLDDGWDYGMYRSSTNVTTSATDNTATTMNIQTQDEEDAVFTRTTNSVDMATTNVVMVVYTARVTNLVTSGRAETQMRLNINAGTIPVCSWNQCYGPRGSNGITQASMSGMCLLYPASGDDLTVELVSRELGGDGWEVELALIELPSQAQTATMEATSGDFAPTTDAEFVWDTLPEIDTAAFTATAGNSNIDVDNAGDYLAIANQAITTDAGVAVTRAVPDMRFRVQTTNNIHSGSTTFNRSSGTADHGAMRMGALLTGLSADDSISVWNRDVFSQNTGALTCNAGAFQVLRMEGLFQATASGAPSLTKPTSTGVSFIEKKASGTPSITKPTSTGVAISTIIHPASGTPQLTKPTSTGVSFIEKTATGTPSITKPTSTGVAEDIQTSAGTATVTKPTSAGNAINCTQVLAPDTIAAQTALAGIVTDIDERVDTPDGNWLILD